jgi:hypothetical protein
LGRTVENTLRPNVKKGITKSSTSLNPAFRCRTVENTLKTKHKERNHKRAAHHSIPAFIGRNWVGLLKNTLRSNTKKGIKRAAHHSTPAFIGGNWVGLLKYSKTKHKEGITKEQHITQPCFHRIWVGLLKNTFQEVKPSGLL